MTLLAGFEEHDVEIDAAGEVTIHAWLQRMYGFFTV